jgi:hypothetical protein
MILGSPNSPQGNGQMNAITLASRKGGVGEITFDPTCRRPRAPAGFFDLAAAGKAA